MTAGRIEVIAGCMFSGKTSELIRRIEKSQAAGLKVRVFKPTVDVRSGDTRILSHDKRSYPAVNVEAPLEILELVEDNDQVIGIDEIQFFTQPMVEVLAVLSQRGLRVIAAGLDTDWRGRPFGIMPNVLAIADQVDKLSAVCAVCGEPARRSHRVVDDSSDILIGNSEYEPRCHSHFAVPVRIKAPVESAAHSPIFESSEQPTGGC